MPDKKKPVKSPERRVIEIQSRTVKKVDSNRPAASSSPSEPVVNAAAQLAAFESAMKAFHARSLEDARALFAKAVVGPERDVAQRARLHIAMCERRLARPGLDLQSADDHYNYGVAQMNARNMAAAREHLEAATRLSPNADHITYALGVAQALSGDLASAYDNLKRSIDLEPRNRIIARQDADLASVAERPPLNALLYPEKAGW
jgi:tetratricopeptide (TPR) repeat protein